MPRSIGDPITSNDVNVSGFLNILTAAKESKTLKRIVYAASLSTYGDSPVLPKIEGNEGNPLSPYAVTELVNELYADVFSKVYGFHTIGLRYFNVFGPKQNPNYPYAAVIPIFCKHFIEGTQPTINGDGLASRDFTFVENAVQANLKTLLVSNIINHDFFNIACGEQSSLNDIVELLIEFSGQKITPVFGPARVGDVKHSMADIKKIIDFCAYNPMFSFYKGLKFTYNFYKNKI